MKNLTMILLVLAFFSTSAYAEVIKANSYIMEWILIGPINDTGPAAISTNVDWLIDSGGETEIRPSEGDEL